MSTDVAASLQEHIIHMMTSLPEGTLVKVIDLLENESRKRNDSGEEDSGAMPSRTTRNPGSLSIDISTAHAMESNLDMAAEESISEATSPTNVAAARGGGRRVGVSAAPVGLKQAREFIPRKIEKTEEEEKMLRTAVHQSHLFASMEEEEQDVIVGAMEKEEFQVAHDILKQGEPTRSKFYLIMEGKVEVIKSGKHIASMGAGQTFGELEMMYSVQECAATIRTVTQAVMYSLDQDTYQNVVLKVSIAKRETYTKMLQSVTFLEGMPEYDRMTLADALTPANFSPGDHIIRFGETGSYMYIIMQGEVQVVGRDKGKKVDVIRLGEGSVIGELEFLFNHLTVADVVAVTKVRSARISRKHFELCMGPITDDLKRLVAKGQYEHYLNSDADEHVKKQIEAIERRANQKRVARGGAEAIGTVSKGGELIIVSQSDADESKQKEQKDQIHRFPLLPLQDSNIVMIGLREDGTISFWNEAMERITRYSAADVQGMNFYSFLLNLKDQENMHNAMHLAVQYAGNSDAFFARDDSDKHSVYTFARQDGLTKTQLQLTVVPPAIAQGKGKVEMLLAVGMENRKTPQNKGFDVTDWLQTQLLQEVQRYTASESTASEKEKHIALCQEIFDKSEAMQKASEVAMSGELADVNLQQFLGQLTTHYSAKAIERGNEISTDLHGVVSDVVFADVKVLNEVMRYFLSNAVNHTQNTKIRLAIDIANDDGMETLRFTLKDNGPGMDAATLKAMNAKAKVKSAITSMGGSLLIESVKGDGTTVTIKIPYLPGEDEEDDLAATTSHHNKKQTFTTLMVEEKPAHRNMLCSFLWDRKHAVLPAFSWGDVLRLVDNSDILVIDLTSSYFQNSNAPGNDPIELLRDRAKKMSVVITSENKLDEATRKAYQMAGFFTLNKPCSALEAVSVFRRAEEKVAHLKSDADKIAAVRDTFTKTSRGEWRKGQLLGKGAFGDVFEATDVLTGGKMAVKCMRPSAKMDIDEVLHEIEVMCNLKHQNIIHYFYCEKTVIDEQPFINVFMEFAPGGTLQSKLQTKTLEPKEFGETLRDIVDGVVYTHQQKFVHRDLKTANILIGSDGKSKIGDFGTAKKLEAGEKCYVMYGTPLYMAPECMNADPDEGIGYDYPADIWSLGCIVFEMATGRQPWYHVVTGGPMGLIGYVSELKDTPDLSPLFDGNPKIFEFVRACLEVDPEKRPTAQQLLDFSLLRDGDDDVSTALKALERQKFIHLLNKFVAFQEPEEELPGVPEAAPMTRRESNFFDSSEDEEEEAEEEEEEAAKPDTPKAVEPDSPPPAATPPLDSVSTAQPSPEPQSRDSEPLETTASTGDANPLAATGDTVQGDSTNSTATVAAPRNRVTLVESEEGSTRTQMEGSDSLHQPPARKHTAVGPGIEAAAPAEGEEEGSGQSAAPAQATTPPTQPAASQNGPAPPSLAPHPPQGKPSGDHAPARSPPNEPIQPPIADAETSAIMLHDALWRLLEKVSPTTVAAVEDPMRAQYRSTKDSGSEQFNVNVAELLMKDVEALNKMLQSSSGAAEATPLTPKPPKGEKPQK